METRQTVFTAMLGVGMLIGPLVAQAQPAIEAFRFDPPQVCLRELLRWGFSYRGVPGGLAGVKTFELTVRWHGPNERSFPSLLTPTRDELQ